MNFLDDISIVAQELKYIKYQIEMNPKTFIDKIKVTSSKVSVF